MFPTKRSNHAIYIEGLPIECVETDLIKLLQSCGKVNAIMLYRQPSPMIPALRPNSVSASVEFQSRENAEAAVYLLETSVIWGRRLSVRMITPNAPLINNSMNNNMNSMNAVSNNNNLNNHVALAASKALRSAQVHISYLTKQLVTIVTEQMIFDLFSTFGKVIEVSLKKKCVDTEMCIQNGYGFVHYPLTAEGIESALRAVETLHQVTINNISYDCSVSNQLKQVLFSTGHLPANKVANSNATTLTNTNNIGNKTHAWMDANAQDAMNSNSRFPSLLNNNNNNANNNISNSMHNNHMNNNINNSRSLFPSLPNGNLLANHNHLPANNMSMNNGMNNINLFNHSNNNNNCDASSLTGRLSLHSGVTSYQGGLSSLDGTNSIGFSSLNSFSSNSNHNNLHLKNASFSDDLFTHANQFSLNNNTSNVNALNGFSSNSNNIYGGASVGSGRSSHEDHSSVYHRSQYKSNSLYNNVPLIAEDDFLFTDTNVNANNIHMNNNSQSSSHNNNLGFGSAKLPGVFNKWF